MTAKELAEKITWITLRSALHDVPAVAKELESLLTSALEEAQKECIGLQVEQCHKHVEQARADGYIQGHIAGEHYQEKKWTKRGMESAYEHAAKIVSSMEIPAYPNEADTLDRARRLLVDGIRQAAKDIK